MFTFKAFYKGKTMLINADTLYAAQCIAAKAFKARKTYDVTVLRTDIVHNGASL